MDYVIAIIGVLAGVGLGLAAGRRLGQKQAEGEAIGLRAQIDLLNQQLASLEQQRAAAADTAAALAPLSQMVEDLRKKAEDRRVEEERARAELQAAIGQVKESNAKLADSTRGLTDAFGRTQAIGSFGEFQLEGLLAASGLIEGVHYRTQVTLGDAGDKQVRPDVMLLFPDGTAVPIDSKCPLEAYQASQRTEDDAERRRLQAQHAEAVLGHAKALSKKKYASAAVGPEMVILFLPFESLYMSALQANPALIEQCNELNVVVASPSSLIAILRASAFYWQRDQLAEFTREIGEASARVLKMLAETMSEVDKVGRGLQAAMNGYNGLVGKLENGAVKSAKALHRAGVHTAVPEFKIGELELAPRELTDRLAIATESFADESAVEADEAGD